jgi:hypothetical protein
MAAAIISTVNLSGTPDWVDISILGQDNEIKPFPLRIKPKIRMSKKRPD